MIQIIVAAALGLILSILGTPLFIRFLASRGYGQFIREDGPSSHQTKRGTPTMGGVAILGSAVIAYLVSHTVVGLVTGEWTGPTASGLLAAFLMLGMGFVGGIDDAKKITKIVRDEGPKGVKATIQGDELRVSSKSRDDLQETIALLKGKDLDVDLQFINFR